MKKIIKYLIPGSKLLLIFLAAVLVLGLINEIVKPVILEKKNQAEIKVLNALYKQENWQKITAVPFSFPAGYFDEQIFDKSSDKKEKVLLLYCYVFDSSNNIYLLRKDLNIEELKTLADFFNSIGYENKDAVKAYYPVEQNERVIAYVLEILGSGFGGEMKIIACFAPDGSIRQVRLLDNNETTGLGKKAELAPYINKFIGTGGNIPIPATKDMLRKQEDLDAVTGATITFMGIADALRAGSHFVKRLEMNDD
jgi:Na+-translocating ferredoxin:NAD+ oxidoreductase RnfG subunit